MKAKTALVVGMARSGIGSAKLLYKNGYRVIINDVKREIPNLAEALSDIEYDMKLGVDPMELLDGVDLMVLSPAIPIFKPFAIEAQNRGIEVIGEIELGYRYASKNANFVCISGTNGKTTSTTLTGEIFKASGRRTYVLGNIGIPITEYASEIKDGDTIVVEVAALQLESIKEFRANTAAMLNISEDHINRFGSMEKYVAAKERIFENQSKSDIAVLNYDDECVRNMAKLTKARIVWFSQKNEVDGAFIRDERIIWRDSGADTEIIHTSELLIPGRHNVENALCCTACAASNGVDFDTIRKVLREFKGVEHRIEFICEKDGIQYFNDSKATNPDSTIRAIEAMNRPTVLILGVGEYDKQSDFTPVFRAFGDKIIGVVASGINVPAILKAARRTGFRNIVIENRGLKEMVLAAKEMAHEGTNILLSPAAASWGMFRDFEERGEVFREIVRSL
ncbi:MAG TPA: UDP-N-acetylmuramoyl-L-alanine--D-glutamate ligase [Clostridiales bacterium]|jgi:UDP-N-acetylmuramoylalanine--D-glutamate ligase|nr:UDP-N-acetylmuramoyl-L-alanine--D-glutamate ligase [Clostridiales bacterium]